MELQKSALNPNLIPNRPTMKSSIPRSLTLTAILSTTLCGLASNSHAALIYGVTDYKELISFDSDSPGTILTSVGITGLTDQFESVAGIDFRPANGQLYALGNAPGSQYRLYTLNYTTGVATQVGSNAITFSSSAFGFGFDFNPVVDRIRIVNNAEENGRLNPNDGTYTADTALNSSVGAPFYQQGIGAAAYTNNVAGATATKLFVVDYKSGGLFEQTPPNNGTLEYVGGLNTSLDGPSIGFDISGQTGIAYLSNQSYDGNTGIFSSNLFTVNLTTGEATSIGNVGTGLSLRDITVFPVPEPSALGLLTLSAGILCCKRRRA